MSLVSVFGACQSSLAPGWDTVSTEDEVGVGAGVGYGVYVGRGVWVGDGVWVGRAHATSGAVLQATAPINTRLANITI